MTSLLSIFDPCHCSYISNFSFLLLSVYLPFHSLWKSPSLSLSIIMSLSNYKVNLSLGPQTFLPMFSLLFFIIFVNLMGLIPLTFSSSSHISINFSISFPLWLSSVIWGFICTLIHSLAHFTPMGCPLILVPFMVLVEVVSYIIRPITLALRLMANMLAGHLILCLTSNLTTYIMFPSLLMLTSLMIFELFVSLIQGYVFTILMIMYWMEITNP
uniref:ATP synthase F0 subunit 6 n=1 Tax=Eomenopon denticulatum TaxID=2965267 RepID=UPI0026E13841|nr:ATP synthase F0 subunit 6 [Eomenopon denticulatum]WIM51539.1 ATP synthase subunit 6 [Eomenopon denticulatum]